MTKPGPRPEKPKPASGDGDGRGSSPVAEIYISKHAENIFMPDGEDIYPPEAKRLGIEGVVVKLSIDEKGRVVQVEGVERAGHGFDEAAREALRQVKFTPARPATAGRSPAASSGRTGSSRSE